MSGDYVSRDYLLGEYDRQHQGPPGGARKIIAEAPAADVVEVVRCRECIYYHDYTCDRWADGTIMKPTDYCSRAAKMDGGQNDAQ